MKNKKKKHYSHTPCGKQKIEAIFTGGRMSADGGLTLVREVDKRTGILSRFAQCFKDFRIPSRRKYSVLEMVCQRVFSIVMGYEDVNDQDKLRHDPMFEMVSNDVKMDRKNSVSGKPLASSKTINRMELGVRNWVTSLRHRYKRIAVDHLMMAQLLKEIYFDQYVTAPTFICLDVDTTHLKLHGGQQGSLFHGHYNCYCYVPLFIFSKDYVLCAELLTIKDNEVQTCLRKLQEIVAEIRSKWPTTQIMIRGDSGFCRDEVLSWCEQEGIEYLFGLAKNSRLLNELEPAMVKVRERHQASGNKEKSFEEIEYMTLSSWSARRRVVGKAECQEKGNNPRFVVSNIAKSSKGAQELYEYYCQRGDIENRIKEQKQVFCGRMSTRKIFSNQTRMYYSAIAYVLLNLLRRLGLVGTKYEKAQCKTMREKLLKMPVVIKGLSKRRVLIKFEEDKEQESIYEQILRNLQRAIVLAPS